MSKGESRKVVIVVVEGSGKNANIAEREDTGDIKGEGEESWGEEVDSVGATYCNRSRARCSSFLKAHLESRLVACRRARRA